MINQYMYSLGANRSCIRDLFEYGLEKAKEVGKENVYDFSLGNPSTPVPEKFSESLRELSYENSLSVHGYTPAAGAPETRAAIADDLTARFGIKINVGDLFFTCGAAAAITAVVSALAVENAEVLGIAPYFAEYKVYVEGNGARFNAVPADTENFQINIPALRDMISANTQAIIINSPNNPSGVIYSEETLKAVAAVLEEKSAEYGHPVYLIADEPYRELVYDGATVPFVPAFYKNTVVCYSYSKSLSMPGDRVGYVCIPSFAEDHDMLFAAVAGAARANGHVCAPALIQKAVARCASIRPDIEVYDTNRKLLYAELSSYGYTCVKPNGAFYMLIKAPDGNAKAFSEFCKQYNLLIVPCADFGIPEFLRLSTCVSTDMIKRSLPAFKKAIEEYNK